MRDAAEFFKVLSDESRLQILWLLFNSQELCVCDIMAALGTTQSKVSRHLATLRHAGLVADRREGAWSYYRLCKPGNEFDAVLLDTALGRIGALPSASGLLERLGKWQERKSAALEMPGGGCCSSGDTDKASGGCCGREAK